MREKHVPDLAFVERLESQIGADVRRRNRYADMPRWTRWLAQSPLKAAVAVGLLILLSMGIGGIVVAAAYQAQSTEERQAVKARANQRVALAQQRVSLAADAVRLAERQTSVGVEPQDTLFEARFKLSEAQAQLQSLLLEAAEVDVSGHDPVTVVSAPLVGGRDFVSERWKAEMQIPVAALDAERARLQTLERRVSVGAASNVDAEVSRTRIRELESAVQALKEKIGTRERFLKKEIDGPLAELYILQTEAMQRHETVAPRLDLAKRVLKDMQARVEVGTAAMLDVSQAQLKLKELELEMTKVDVDLAVIRSQIIQKRAGK